MCVIVDACVASATFGDPPSEDMKPVLSWILERDGRLVYGGCLGHELGKVDRARRLLVQLARSGKALLVKEGMEEEEEALRSLRICRSNDVHVLALARLSGARTLCTTDGRLQVDFKNAKVINSPRGKIYTSRTHARLLTHTPTSCGLRNTTRRRRRSKRK